MVARGTLVALVLSSLLLPAGAAAGSDPLDSSRRCRAGAAKQAARLARVAFRTVDRCHARRDKGKVAGDCNDLDIADPKGKIDGVAGKARAALDKACPAADPVRALYPGGDVAGHVVDSVLAARRGKRGGAARAARARERQAAAPLPPRAGPEPHEDRQAHPSSNGEVRARGGPQRPAVRSRSR